MTDLRNNFLKILHSYHSPRGMDVSRGKKWSICSPWILKVTYFLIFKVGALFVIEKLIFQIASPKSFVPTRKEGKKFL